MAKNKSTIIAVFDAGPIIHLDELGCLDIISDFKENLLPNTVWEEISQYRPSALNRSGRSLTRLVKKYSPDEQLQIICRIFSLDAGETEALVIMGKYPNAILFTDDGAARLVAEQMGYNVHGTIGILVRSIRRRQRKPEQVLSTLREVPLKSTLYVKLSLLEEVINKIKIEYHL